MELDKYFRKITEDLTTLTEDILRIKSSKAKNKDQKISEAEKNITSFRSLMPRVILRKNEDEIRRAKENPEETMIIDKLNDILK